MYEPLRASYKDQDRTTAAIFKNHEQTNFKTKDQIDRARVSPLPLSPHHFVCCLTCAGKDQSRGTGFIRCQRRYIRGDGEVICEGGVFLPCPDCNGHGILLTALGQECQRQSQEDAKRPMLRRAS
ncbi:Uncharacterised protein [Zhongshania aliphaticivorans]|uniref:Uncharacterized protein n=1 Tax=Zhongshania aliphaticivorans TaxID=1470434 RepID=A0A5S9N8E3_9GAMM|nr:hypothetical protein [Zhongshania aliphaticivorans]CAA0081216.1 Uncharacterised protein [Zhongshania aliphaticivorans]CAA0085192.1 Uncharacterised protein [Zhongshania aliphaticivorans]